LSKEVIDDEADVEPDESGGVVLSCCDGGGKSITKSGWRLVDSTVTTTMHRQRLLYSLVSATFHDSVGKYLAVDIHYSFDSRPDFWVFLLVQHKLVRVLWFRLLARLEPGIGSGEKRFLVNKFHANFGFVSFMFANF
jgi:hypothetical protein